jgi:membrane protease subunit (stomatin/prohibitin family)
VEEALDKRTSMGVVGDLNKLPAVPAAEAMRAAAENPGGDGGMGAGLGMGMGMAMANQMANMGPWGAQPQAAPAQPPPAPAAGRTCLAHRRERRDQGARSPRPPWAGWSPRRA